MEIAKIIILILGLIVTLGLGILFAFCYSVARVGSIADENTPYPEIDEWSDV